MTIVKELTAGVNELSGSDREEYRSFIGGLLTLQCAAANRFGLPADEYIRELYSGMSKSELVGVLVASGWKARVGETQEAFDARLRTLPLFRQLPLDDDEADFIEDGSIPNASETDFIEDVEADIARAKSLLATIVEKHGGPCDAAKEEFFEAAEADESVRRGVIADVCSHFMSGELPN